MSDSPPPLDNDLAAGTKIGFYEVVGRTDAAGKVVTRVGSGGFGSLYRVRRENTDYALKMSKLKMSELGAADRKHHEDRFRREVSILLALSHPNIVRVHAFDCWPTRDGHPFLIMDFVDGERLYEWQRKLAPSLRSICDVFIKTALALHELHRHGIFHRDIKSDNLVVRPDGEPVLLDMGIARSGANFTVTAERSVLGTFAHFSPEQCRCYLSEEFQRGAKRFEQTPQSELHSLGYMLYEVLTGRAPFPPGEDEFALMRSIAHVVPVPPSMVNPRVPGALDSVAMRLLEKDPLQRPESGQVLATDLDRLVADASDSSWDAPFDVPLPLAHDAPTPPSRRLAARPVSDERGAPKKPVSAERPVAGPAAPARATSIEKPQPPELDGRFSPPTVDKSPFQSPVPSVPAHVAAPAVAADQAHTLQGEMATVAAKLGTASRSAQRSRVTQGALVLGILLVIGGVLALMSQGAKMQKPRNLLAEVQKNEKAAALDGGAVASPAASPANATAALVPSRPASVEKPPAVAEKKAVAANRDTRDFDAEIAREYGRPTIPDSKTKAGAVAQPPHERPKPEQPAWLQVAIPQEPAAAKRTATSSSAAGAMAASLRYGVPTGAHIRARLQTNLDSRTVGSGPVEATLMRPFLANGKAIFPSRTMLYGAAQTSGARFIIRFTRVRLPDDTEIQFEGLAYDTAERKPGLPGRVVGAPVVQPGNNTGGKIAATVASTALGAVGGDPMHDAAREAGQVALRDATNSEGQVGSGSTLLLDAGQDFDVFVSKRF